MIKTLTCIVCPIGCKINIDLNNDKITNVTGNTCKRGADYANSEILCPKRTITTTIKSENGKIIPVKTAEPILKEQIFNAMHVINKIKTKTPIKVGEIIVKDFFGTCLVATKNVD